MCTRCVTMVHSTRITVVRDRDEASAQGWRRNYLAFERKQQSELGSQKNWSEVLCFFVNLLQTQYPRDSTSHGAITLFTRIPKRWSSHLFHAHVSRSVMTRRFCVICKLNIVFSSKYCFVKVPSLNELSERTRFSGECRRFDNYDKWQDGGARGGLYLGPEH